MKYIIQEGNDYWLAKDCGATNSKKKAYRYSEEEAKYFLRHGSADLKFIPVEEKQKFEKIGDSIVDLLNYKDNKYGESALNPIEIFNGKTLVGQRLDDKISRVKNNPTLQKNDVADIIGYLFLVCKENGWEDFSEFKD